MAKVLQVDIEAEPVRLPKETVQSFGLFSKEFIHTVMDSTCLEPQAHGSCLTLHFIAKICFRKTFSAPSDGFLMRKILNAVSEVYRIAGTQTLFALCSIVPGYLFAVAFIEKIGRFTIQVMGFIFMTVFMFILAFLYNYWTHEDHLIGFVVFYSLSSLQISDLMALHFPARLRSTCHGISAAAGKLEAMVGALCSSKNGAIFWDMFSFFSVSVFI
ncbi:hypothetical protein ACFX2C_004089 [Malus domestica]